MNCSSLPSRALILCPLSLIPPFISNSVLTKLFNQVFKEALEDGELDFLINKNINIEVIDFDIQFNLCLQYSKLQVSEPDSNPDLVFSGKAYYFLALMARKEDPDTLFFQRHLKMQGDTELGLYIKNFLDAFDIESHWLSKQVDKFIQLSYPLAQKILQP